ncbi:MAG: substrate-binding domain-containing protein, partial [Lentisphaeria bacterium]|nr:substrate-binding domain-containing protein [Lentisphaeria bacterium]
AAAAKRLLSNKKNLDAVICADDLIAAGVADVLTKKELCSRIPVCGINNSYLAAELQFSSVDLNLAERARQAAGLLADLLEGKAPPSPHIIRIKPKFIERIKK